MKILSLSIALLVLFVPAKLYSQSSQVEPVSLEQALRMAPEQEKKILVDVYAAWCPYCQRMHSEVYVDSDVVEAINEHFILVRINVESDETVSYLGNEMSEAEFARALENRNVPTTYFLNHEGAIIGAQPGYLEEGVFSNLLNFVGSDAFLTQTFDEYLENR
ncbi:MAG: thioredoxin family protein [Balneolaceae bacterium]|nr:thioredoxin family protein [Balneolaceae bacterium]